MVFGSWRLVVVASLIVLFACGENRSPAGDDADGDADAAIPDAGVVDTMPLDDAMADARPDAQCTTELCNGSDDDCDGFVDEGLGLGDGCTEGDGACERTGSIVCGNDGGTVCNVVPGDPSDEICNGSDDDCDGTTDDVPGLGDACDTGEPGVCAPGTRVCDLMTNGLVCTPLSGPTTEACNTLDDDCDGVPDDGDPGGGLACDTGGIGVCALGLTRCDMGSIACDPQTSASTEVCNTLDDDCDGTVDDACLPATPEVRAPWSGYQTGSLWAEGAAGVAATPLRPTFRWAASTGATVYRFELEDSCTTVAGCTFPSPAVDLETGALAFTPVTALAVNQSAPVGRRYYFRIRACNANGCSAPSPTHYVDVGRVDGDVDGDGYPDLLVTASMSDKGYLFRGSSTGLQTTPTRTFATYEWPRMAGDVDGDGYTDAIVTRGDHATYQGRVYVIRGGPSGLEASPSQTIDSPIAGNYVFFSHAQGAGDVNGDGYADLIIGAPGAADVGAAFVFFGSPTGIDVTSYRTLPTPMGSAEGFFGSSVGFVGDVNADGLADFAVADAEWLHDGFEAGAVAVYAGRFTGPSAVPMILIENPYPNRRWFGGVVTAAGDADGDGYSDLLTSPMTGYQGTPYRNNIFIYRGGPGGPDGTPDVVIPSPLNVITSFAADLVGDVDVDGDGRPELLASDELADSGQSGRAYLFRAGPTTPIHRFLPPLVQYTGHFGSSVALCDHDSDGYGDSVISQLNHGDPAMGAVFVYRGSATGPSASPSVTLMDPEGGSSYFGTLLSCRR